VRWPEDFFTAVGILIFLMVLVWWRNRFPSRHDITLHLDQDAKKPPPDAEAPDGGHPS
jgi:hypothetical protein